MNDYFFLIVAHSIIIIIIIIMMMMMIMLQMLRATGKPYHPCCFTCVVCGKNLDGLVFTVDATNQIHCIDDFHRSAPPLLNILCRFAGRLLELFYAVLCITAVNISILITRRALMTAARDGLICMKFVSIGLELRSCGRPQGGSRNI